MNKFIAILSILFISTLSAFATTSWDNNQTTDPTVFKVKPISMQLCEDFSLTTGVCSGDNTYTITKTMTADDGRCDIAGAEPNAIACNFGSFDSPTLPSGVTYSYVRTELSRTMWLKGTVTNTGSNSGLASCMTDSTNVQADNSTYAEGKVTGSPTLQAINFANGPGNEAYQGNASKTSANTLSAYDCTSDWNAQACSWNYITSLQTQGATHYGPGTNGTTNWGAKDYYMFSAYYQSNEHIWMSDVEESDTSMILIYLLSTPYTTKAGITPTLKMSFSVENALDADFVKSEEAGKDDVQTCVLYVGSPGVTISLYD